MTWHPVTRLPLELDLSEFVALARQRNIVLHVNEEGGQQQIWIHNLEQADVLAALFQQWQSGELLHSNSVQTEDELAEQDSVAHQATQPQDTLQEPARKSALEVNSSQPLWVQVVQSPATSITVLLGILGALLVASSNWAWVGLFTIQTVSADGMTPSQPFLSIASGEIWCLLTPAWLHFGVLHIVFNALWVWLLGRVVECRFGVVIYVLLFSLTAITANVLQYGISGNVAFGGLSGVVYGLFGFVAVRQWLSKGAEYYLPKSLYGFMAAWLVLGFAGVIDLFIDGGIANMAHAGGLLAGLILGGLSVFIHPLLHAGSGENSSTTSDIDIHDGQNQNHKENND